MSVLIVDTETTGKWKKDLAVDHPSQPHLVQLSAILYDANRSVRGSMAAIVEPKGWKIPEDVVEVHGITTEDALCFGVALKIALDSFYALAAKAKEISAFNADFDSKIVKAATFRAFGVPWHWSVPEKPWTCTMLAMKDRCKIPSPYGYADWKWPSLDEAIAHAFPGVKRRAAHKSSADAVYAAKLHFWLKDNPAKEGK